MTRLRPAVLAFFVPFLSGAPEAARAQCAPCPNASFGPAARDFLLGSRPEILATADFDGDGLLDIASNGSNGIAILRGTPGGNFSAPSFIVVSASHLVVADFDGDGRMDLATALYSVSLFRGRGDGGFEAQRNFPAGDFPWSLAVGDLDGDGRPDLVVTNLNTGFSALLNDGHGGFGPPRFVPVPTYGGPALLADFNRDGNLDVLISAPYIGLFFGNGDGTFSPSAIPGPYLAPSGVAVAKDFDRDGNLDIARIASELDIFYGNGDGTFDAPVPIAPIFAFYASALASADFNRDGWPDLIATFHPNRVELFLSNGTGGFQAPFVYTAGPTPGALLAADFDRDGIPDAAVANSDSNTLTLLRGRSDGSLLATPSLPAAASALATADFNGDAKADLVVGGTGVSVWIGDGTGQFVSGYSDGSPTEVRAVGAADLNGDGEVDFVAASSIGFFPTSGKLWTFLGNGAGGFSPLPDLDLGFAPKELQIGAVNAGVVPDLVVTSPTGIHLLFGLGDGTFAPAVTLGTGSAFDGLVLRDFNGDTKLDIAAARYSQRRVSVHLGFGDGTFSPSSDYVLDGDPYVLTSGDFNADGKLDLLSGNLYSNLGLSLLRGRGDGTFEPAFSFPSVFVTFGLTSFDFNADGKPDLAVSDGGSQDLLLMAGQGDGTFAASARFATGGTVGRSVTGNWNGDGRADLAVLGATDISILLNTNCAARRLGMTVQPGTCATPGAAFPTQPRVGVFDDGDNTVTCTTGSVSASLVPGTGTAGASLGGGTLRPLVSGVATFTNLSINLAGDGYELQFQHSVAGVVRGRPVSVHPPYAVGITGPSAACSVTLADFSADAGFDGYLWLVDGVERGAGRSFSPFGLPPGPHTIEVRATKAGCSATASLPVTSSPTGPACALSFFTVPPCRLLDTRASEAPALTSGIDRVFRTIGHCGIPPTAKAISANVTITEPTQAGHLTLFPTGGAFPATSVLNFSAGQTRANNSVLTLGLGRDITARCTQSFGAAHVVLDVNGYFE